MTQESKDKRQQAQDKKSALRYALVGFFTTTGQAAQRVGRKAFDFAKKTADENPVLVETAFVVAATMKLHPKIRFAILAGHTIFKLSQQNKPK